MAEDGRKMSKSLGNQVFPQDVIKQSGADILRLWVATTDYWEDQRLGKSVIQTNVDAYRKLRNTIRWMLGTLAHDEGENVPLAEMPELERLMLHRLSELDEIVRGGYDAFDFKRVAKSLLDFMVVDLSAFYFDIRKDALYCDGPSSVKRKAALQVVRHLFDCLAKWLAPILPFTTEEAWLDRHPGAQSLHLDQMADVPVSWRDDMLAEEWRKVRQMRRVVTGALEIARAEKQRGVMFARMRALFARYDLILCPATIVAPFPVEQRYLTECNGHKFSNYVEWRAIVYAFTNVASPAISIPAGFTAENLPVGLQIAAPCRGEGRLLAAAKLLEDILGLGQITPINPRPGT